MRSQWRDGERIRAVEVSVLGGGHYRVSVDGAESEVEAERLGDGRLRLMAGDSAFVAEVTAEGERRFVRLGTLEFVLERAPDAARAGRRRAEGGGGLEAPMPGVVSRVMVSAGDPVKKGQPLVALEAMKMEHLIRSPRDGRVRAIAARAGEMVNGGVTLVELEDGTGTEGTTPA